MMARAGGCSESVWRMRLTTTWQERRLGVLYVWDHATDGPLQQERPSQLMVAGCCRRGGRKSTHVKETTDATQKALSIVRAVNLEPNILQRALVVQTTY